MGPPRPLLLHSSHSSCGHRSRWRPLYRAATVASAAAVSRSSAGSTQGPSGAGSWSNGSRGLGPSGAVAGSAARRGGARACAGRVAAARTTACRRRTRCGRAGLHGAGGARRSGAGAEAGQTGEELQEPASTAVARACGRRTRRRRQWLCSAPSLSLSLSLCPPRQRHVSKTAATSAQKH